VTKVKHKQTEHHRISRIGGSSTFFRVAVGKAHDGRPLILGDGGVGCRKITALKQCSVSQATITNTQSTTCILHNQTNKLHKCHPEIYN